MELLEKIVDYGQRWNGVEEIPGNQGWENKEFQRLMERVNWEMGQAWCMFYVKMVYLNVFRQVNQRIAAQVDELFTGSATETFRNCLNHREWTTATEYPLAGTIVIWRKWDDGQPDWRGHAGIVTYPGPGMIGDPFKSQEGNTNSQGGRAGKEVAIMDRINNHGETDGLVVEGFIFPPMDLEKIDPKTVSL